MSFVPSPTQSEVQVALRAFLLSILPPGVEVVQGQDNRVPEPAGADFVIITAMSRTRLATNIDTYTDVLFTGSVSTTVLTVTAINFGVVRVGATLFGPAVAAGTTIVSLGTGTGGVGTYNVSVPQTVASGPLAAGGETIQQNTQVDYQLDVHGPNSADNAQAISTLFRDEYATSWWTSNGFTTSAPLYADDPRQMPFVNENQQVENRWTITARLESDQTVTVPLQFAGALHVNLVDLP